MVWTSLNHPAIIIVIIRVWNIIKDSLCNKYAKRTWQISPFSLLQANFFKIRKTFFAFSNKILVKSNISFDNSMWLINKIMMWKKKSGLINFLGGKLLRIFPMIYSFAIAMTRIHFTICEVKSNNSNSYYCCSYSIHIFSSNWSNGLVVRALDSQSKGLVFKTTGWLQGWLRFLSFQGHSNEYQELTSGNLVVKGKLYLCSGSLALRP